MLDEVRRLLLDYYCLKISTWLSHDTILVLLFPLACARKSTVKEFRGPTWRFLTTMYLADFLPWKQHLSWSSLYAIKLTQDNTLPLIILAPELRVSNPRTYQIQYDSRDWVWLWRDNLIGIITSHLEQYHPDQGCPHTPLIGVILLQMARIDLCG